MKHFLLCYIGERNPFFNKIRGSGYEAKIVILGEVVEFTSIKTRRMIWDFCFNELRQNRKFSFTEVCVALGGIFSSLPEKDRKREWEELLMIVAEEDPSAPARKFSALKVLKYASLSNNEAELFSNIKSD